MKFSKNIEADMVRLVSPAARFVEARPLTGGVSALIYALVFEQPDGTVQQCVLRIHGNADRARNPNVAEDEFCLLETLHPNNIPVPKPLLVDKSCQLLPVPYLLTSYIDGASGANMAPSSERLAQLAQQLVNIHQLRLDEFRQHPLPSNTINLKEIAALKPRTMDHSIGEPQIRQALRSIRPQAQTNPSTLLHGDYWPGNTLWRNDLLVGIVDWEDASAGDPLEDLAIARLELAMLFDLESAIEFTNAYLALNPINAQALTLWDLIAALRPAFKLDGWAESGDHARALRRRHRLFVEFALSNV